jgi:hypothetical protein
VLTNQVFIETNFPGECYTDIKRLETECIDAVKEHVMKGPVLITKLDIWLELDPFKHASNKALLDSLVDGSKTTLFDKTLELFGKPINNCNKLCVDFVLSHVKSTLSGVHLSQEWVVEEGAVFSPSPLSYITNLGDYLLLLPQQLEPFFTEENIPLDTALRLVDFTQFPGMAHGWYSHACAISRFMPESFHGVKLTRTILGARPISKRMFVSCVNCMHRGFAGYIPD